MYGNFLKTDTKKVLQPQNNWRKIMKLYLKKPNVKAGLFHQALKSHDSKNDLKLQNTWNSNWILLNAVF